MHFSSFQRLIFKRHIAGGIYEKEEKEVGEQKNLKQMIKKVN